ncbi:hypothetical protein THAOC_15500, partial [Thalassiosira oceanica]
PQLDGLLLVKDFMELTFGFRLSGARRAGRRSCGGALFFEVATRRVRTASYQKEGTTTTTTTTTTTSRTDKIIKSDQTTLWPCPPVRTPVGVGAAHVAPLMRGDLAGPQMKQSGQSGAASTSEGPFDRDASDGCPFEGGGIGPWKIFRSSGLAYTILTSFTAAERASIDRGFPRSQFDRLLCPSPLDEDTRDRCP